MSDWLLYTKFKHKQSLMDTYRKKLMETSLRNKTKVKLKGTLRQI